MGWQQKWVEQLQDRVVELDGCRSLQVFGSVTSGELDRWSDLDVELIMDGPTALADLAPWLQVWAYEEQGDGDQVLRLFDVDGRHLDLVARGGRLTGLPAIDPVLNELRFLLALATVKFGRGDRLVGAHLLLGAARAVLVEAMELRDADTGTQIHRSGTRRDHVADRVLATLSPPSPTNLAAVFDDLRGERDPAYRADWSGLRALGVHSALELGGRGHT